MRCGRSLLPCLIPIFAFGLALAACSAGDDDSKGLPKEDFPEEDDQDDESSPCSNNAAPQLTGPIYLLDQQQLTPPITIGQEDIALFGIYFEYADNDCNLVASYGEGHLLVNINDQGWQDLGGHPDDIGCSTEQTGYIYGFNFAHIEPGDYAGQAKITDACDADSNPVSFEFSVAASR